MNLTSYNNESVQFVILSAEKSQVAYFCLFTVLPAWQTAHAIFSLCFQLYKVSWWFCGDSRQWLPSSVLPYERFLFLSFWLKKMKQKMCLSGMLMPKDILKMWQMQWKRQKKKYLSQIGG